MSDVWRVHLRIGANGSEYENAGIIADDPYSAIAAAIGEIPPSVQVLQVARFVDIDAGWELVHGGEDLSGKPAAALERDPTLGGKLHDVHGGPGQDCWCGYAGHDPALAAAGGGTDGQA